MKPDELVTAKRHHPRNAIFVVLERTSNGWLRCRAIELLDGTVIAPERIFCFRSSSMRLLTDDERARLAHAGQPAS
jgi:hypothetical protein